MNCGDVVYRSTLNTKLRAEEGGFTAGGFSILALALTYLSVTPGAAGGFLDYYLFGPLAKSQQPKLSLDDLTFLRKLGEGGFGDVWLARYKETGKQVVVKCARAFGAEEVWMNERAALACPGRTARFITSFKDSRKPALPAAGSGLLQGRGNGGGGWMPGNFPVLELPSLGDIAAGRLPWERRAPGEGVAKKAKEEEALWLVWESEGDSSLADYMRSADFPYNLEIGLFGSPLTSLPRGPQRAAATVRALMRQLLDCLAALHSSGIVHRDVKPDNFVVADADLPGKARLVLIDLGAAADLRVGINYQPREYLLDPRFAAPETYVMSTQTPTAPPVPVALLLSPALWQLNLPDRFDLFSAGLVLLQLALPPLRNDGNLIAFRRALDKSNCDLEAWRDAYERRNLPGVADGFALLDADAGAGWDLVLRLLRVPAPLRLSAGAAARHRFMAAPNVVLRGVDAALVRLTDTAASGPVSTQTGWVLRRMARSGTAKEGGFTEAQMERLAALERTPSVKEAKGILGRAIRDNATIASAGMESPGAGGRRRMLQDTKTVAQVAREGVVNLGLVKKLNFWGRFEDE